MKSIIKRFIIIRMNMKYDRIKRKIKRHCRFDDSTIFFETASVINRSHDKSRIILGGGNYIRGDLQVLGNEGRVEIGKNCYVGENTHIWSGAEIIIGDRVLISHNCNIFDNDIHPLESAARHEHFMDVVTKGQYQNADLRGRPIMLENDVWLGANAIISRGGIVIGEGAVIAAGSVVTHSIPPYVVAAGNPAKVVRHLK